MAIELDNVRRTSIPDHIAGEVRDKILSGEILSGERIVEYSLAKRIGVSQGAVREALIQLENEGFVTRYPNRRTVVTQLTLQEVTGILQVRWPLEMLAIELAKKNLNPTHERAIRKATDKMVAAFRRRAGGEFAQADYAFHETIWKITGNQDLVRVITSLCARLFAFGITRNVLSGWEKLRSNVEIHAALAESLISDDVQTCQENMKKHIEHFWGEEEEASAREEHTSVQHPSFFS